MEKIKISEKLKIESILPDGFSLIRLKRAIIPDLFFLRDKELKHSFKKGDIIKITVENVEEMKKDEDLILYCVVNQICSGGFYTKYMDENKFKQLFFYSGKGLLTTPILAHGNPFEVGDYVKISLQ